MSRHHKPAPSQPSYRDLLIECARHLGVPPAEARKLNDTSLHLRVRAEARSAPEGRKRRLG